MDHTAHNGWSIAVSELAELTGVTVRALHHYDDIGLLHPSHRTPSGHRRYGAAEVERLQRIVALRSCGLSLDDVTSVLDEPDGSTRAVAQRQLEVLRARQREIELMQERLKRHLHSTLIADGNTFTDSAMELTAMTIRLDTITTRTGDDGSTSLTDGARTAKTDPRIEAIGAVDELNAAIGVAISHLVDDTVTQHLRLIQYQLFALGADLATPTPGNRGRRITSQATVALEKTIEEVNLLLSPLSSFVLPGGQRGAAQLHLARTACRAAERRVWSLDHVDETAVYLNRLSDLLFVLARKVTDGDETTWDQDVATP